MEIKICGITNLKDAICAVESGADAIGFIFYRQSPRHIEPQIAREIIKKLPRHIARVGVFVNHDPHEIKDIFSRCGLTMIQLHGDESPEYCFQFPLTTLIKAASPTSEDDLDILKRYSVKAVLMDTRDDGQFGGTGKKCDWSLAVRVKSQHPLILAGGLTETNIREAIKLVSPHAVDLNSGVEQFPGKKDPMKIKNVIKIIHGMNQSHAEKSIGSDLKIFCET
jgi:phosphoribosylanthranilate isomerase